MHEDSVTIWGERRQRELHTTGKAHMVEEYQFVVFPAPTRPNLPNEPPLATPREPLVTPLWRGYRTSRIVPEQYAVRTGDPTLDRAFIDCSYNAPADTGDATIDLQTRQTEENPRDRTCTHRTIW